MTADLAEAAALLIERLGADQVLKIAVGLSQAPTPGWATLQRQLSSLPPDPERRLLLERTLEQAQAGGLTPDGMACILRAAGLSAARIGDQRRVELVWSGPASRTPPSRLTEQAMIEVIDSARKSLLLVCYTVHRIASLKQSLLAALARGVQMTLVLEDRDNTARMTLVALRDLARGAAGFRRFYIWPREEKHPDGVMNLHVKCMVADRSKMLLGSANITKAAMERNMELGVLITGGDEPGDVVDHFLNLIREGILLLKTVDLDG